MAKSYESKENSQNGGRKWGKGESQKASDYVIFFPRALPSIKIFYSPVPFSDFPTDWIEPNKTKKKAGINDIIH